VKNKKSISPPQHVNVLDVIIDQYAVEKDDLPLICRTQENVLPIEIKSIQSQWPKLIIHDIDQNLHEKYPIIDAETILGMTGVPYHGVPTPRFAFYDVSSDASLDVEINDAKASDWHYVKYRKKMENVNDVPKNNIVSILTAACVAEIIAALLLGIMIDCNVGSILGAFGIAAIFVIHNTKNCQSIKYFSTSFSGIIPVETKKRMKEASDINPNLKFYILQEEIKWNGYIDWSRKGSLSWRDHSQKKPDTLLVANMFVRNRDKICTNVYYLVDKYVFLSDCKKEPLHSNGCNEVKKEPLHSNDCKEVKKIASNLQSSVDKVMASLKLWLKSWKWI